MLLKQTRRVPSWSVAVIGALMVAVSVALGPVRLHGLEEAIRDERGAVSELRESNRRGWSSHHLADGRAAAADTMAASIEQTGSTPRSFRLGRAGYHLQAAILAMWASTGATDDSQLRPRVEAMQDRLFNADLNAYDELSDLLDELRLGSAEALNAQATQIVDSERRV